MEIHFVGLLANVDESILNLNRILRHDFKVYEVKNKEYIEFDHKLSNSANHDIWHKLFTERILCRNSKIYYIHKSFKNKIPNNDKNKFTNMFDVESFDIEEFNGYLIPLIGFLRLFKEGAINIPLNYYYIKEDNKYNKFRTWNSLIKIHGDKFTLNLDEIVDLNIFLKNTELPFKLDYIQFAFDNFINSYESFNINLRFLSIINGLETLFHPSNNGELKYRISRNLAVTIGKNKDDAKVIYDKMKKLYNKRSNLVHNGKADINANDLLLARHYLRESIKKVNSLPLENNKNNNILNDFLTAKGFGEYLGA